MPASSSALDYALTSKHHADSMRRGALRLWAPGGVPDDARERLGDPREVLGEGG